MSAPKVAYIVSTPRAVSYRVGQMILPQLEAGTHGAHVVAMFFFDDNLYALRKGHPLGERIARIAKENNIILMMCDACALERGQAIGETRWCAPDGQGRKTPGHVQPVDTVEGVLVGCFPDLYAALATQPPDYIITI
ncbi:MAG: SaoD/DsrE family protein [Candidatus Carbobacillus sp.]|nr:SaoD/DsrE family protein [Candidatus Carbobacillus sp.]